MTIYRNESTVVSHERCPKCADTGRDRHGDNLAVYSDGHEYCFACGYRKAAPNSLSNLRKKYVSQDPQDANRIISTGGMLSPSRGELPEKARAWLHKYGITESEYRTFQLFYIEDRQLLCFPVYKHSKLVYYNGRYFGPEPKHSKYVAVGTKPITPTICRAREESKVFVAVEDFISAIKISRQFNAICLFGTHLKAPEKLPKLRNVINVNRNNQHGDINQHISLRIWLDFDKYSLAIKHAARARQYIPDCATIVTPKDPKCYTDEEIHGFVSRITESVS